MKDLIDLLSEPSGIGIVALSIIGIIYLVKEFISFLQENVLPEIFKWRLERRKLILPFAERVLDRDWKESAYFRLGLPKYIDFDKGYILIRPEVNLILSKLKNHRFVRIEGPPSSGKSIIALTIAYQHLKAKKTVIYFNRPTSIPESFFENILLSHRSQLDKNDVLIILDDVHLDIAQASKLFLPIFGNLESVRLLFVSRPLSSLHDEDFEEWQYVFTQYMPKIEIHANYALTQLPDFYSTKKFGKPISPITKSVFVNECGNDILLLSRYLSEWDGTSTVVIENIRFEVYKTVRDHLERLKQVSPDAVTVFLVLGVFYRFEIEVEERFLNYLGLDISYLARNGV